MKKTLILLIIIVASSCSSIMYKNRRENNSIRIFSKEENYTIYFPNTNEKIQDIKTKEFTYQLPALNKNYTTIELKKENHETQLVKVKKTVREIPLILDLIAIPITFGIPLIIDLFKSDFYKISNQSREIHVEFKKTQNFLTSEFKQIQISNDLNKINSFIDENSYFNEIELAINLRDSLEFNKAIMSKSEQVVRDFINLRPNSIYVSKAKDTELIFKNSKDDYTKISGSNSIEEFEYFLNKYPNSLEAPSATLTLLNLVEKDAFESKSAEKQILYYNNYLLPKSYILNKNEFLNRREKILEEILVSIKNECANKKSKDLSKFFTKFKAIKKDNIPTVDINSILDGLRIEISNVLFNDIKEINNENAQNQFLSGVIRDFENLYEENSVLSEILINSKNKNGKIYVFNGDLLSSEFQVGRQNNKYKNILSNKILYKNQYIDILTNSISQTLNFKNNFLSGIQEYKLSNGYEGKLEILNNGISNENFYYLGNLIASNFYNQNGEFLYRYEFERETNLTLQKLDQDIINLENLAKGKSDEENIRDYTALLNNKFPKELDQNLKLNMKVESLKKTILEKQLAERKIRLEQERKAEELRELKEKQRKYISGIYRLNDQIAAGIWTYVMFNEKGVYIIAVGSDPSCLLDVKKWFQSGTYIKEDYQLHLSNGKTWQFVNDAIIRSDELTWY